MTQVSIWEQEAIVMGRHQGRQEGSERIVLRQLRRRFGEITAENASRLSRLSTAQLDDLGEALLDFTEQSDLEAWLAAHEVE